MIGSPAAVGREEGGRLGSVRSVGSPVAPLRHRVNRLTALVLAVLFVLAVSCSSGGGTSEPAADGGSSKLVFKEADSDISVARGDTFAIRLKANPSVGDSWQVVQAPDPRVAEPKGEPTMKYDSPNPEPGAGGQMEFKYKAVGDGTTTIRFYDCYRCSPGGTVAPSDTQYARTLEFRVTVG